MDLLGPECTGALLISISFNLVAGGLYGLELYKVLQTLFLEGLSGLGDTLLFMLHYAENGTTSTDRRTSFAEY